MGFNIRVEKEDEGSVCLYLEGELDVRTSPLLKRAMAPYFSDDFQQVKIVLNDLSRMDSSGIATFVEGLKWSRLSGSRFILSGLTDAVRDMLVLSKLEHEFEILDDGI